jgi:hypothetical protein
LDEKLKWQEQAAFGDIVSKMVRLASSYPGTCFTCPAAQT